MSAETSCTDVDECAADACEITSAGNAANCTNIPGSFECTCLEGFEKTEGNGNSCSDIDECATGDICNIQSQVEFLFPNEFDKRTKFPPG